jgi:hypothetical protein
MQIALTQILRPEHAWRRRTSAACRSGSGFLETSEYVVELLLYFKLGPACHARLSVAFTGTEERLSGQTAQGMKWAAFTSCKGNSKIAPAPGVGWSQFGVQPHLDKAPQISIKGDKRVMAMLDESEKSEA